MQGQEKRLNDIKIRLTDTEFMTVSKLAMLDDRTVADYLHHLIQNMLFGLSTRLDACDLNHNKADSHQEGQ